MRLNRQGLDEILKIDEGKMKKSNAKRSRKVQEAMDDWKKNLPVFKELAESKDLQICWMISLNDQLLRLNEKVQKQAEVIVRIGSYNPERTQEAHC